jgi:hypothetical protein
MTALPTRNEPTNGLASAISTGIAKHPEWWTVALCLFAWIALVAGDVGGSDAIALCGSFHRIADFDALIAGAGGWALMVAAMMLPLVVVPVRRTARASLWRRRHRAVAEFLIGYGLIWLPFGAVALAFLTWWQPQLWVTAATFAVAAIWELSPLKRRALILCHRTIPLRPSGWQADLDCLRYGAIQGRSCLLSCWAIMLAPMVTPQRLPAMAVVALLCWLERFWPRRRQRFETLALGGTALGFVVLALA